ncbi:LuxR C-terminal-related transcriptional regulator [Pseudomonas sp. 3A(2025)]
MNAHALFPQIGKVIASTGSRHFPRLLHDLIQTQLSVDATHIRQLQAEASGQAWTRDEMAILSEAAFWEQDAHAPRAEEAAQLHLSRHSDGYRYEISVYRAGQPQGFSFRERSLLQDISPLLLPMVEKHISALQPSTPQVLPPHPDDACEPQNLCLRFSERLRQSGLDLSTREREVCVGLLAGQTAPQLAEQLQLKVNTVESYLKRASIKLGIGGRHSLMRWMYAGDKNRSEMH